MNITILGKYSKVTLKYVRNTEIGLKFLKNIWCSVYVYTLWKKAFVQNIFQEYLNEAKKF